MNNYRLIYFLTFYISVFETGEGYITRLPECGIYQANFTKSENTYFQGNLTQIILNVSRSECVVSCITKSEYCMFVNHNNLNNTCELQNTSANYYPDEKKIINATGWYFMYTDYKSLLRGEKCSNENPCDENEICYDDCSSKGYYCHKLTNVATYDSEADFFMSSTKLVSNISFAIDGNFETAAKTNETVRSYWAIDMILEQHVEYIKAIIGSDNYASQIHIGNNLDFRQNQLCIDVPKEPTANKTYYCTDSALKGRYVHFDRLSKHTYAIYEVQIFVL